MKFLVTAQDTTIRFTVVEAGDSEEAKSIAYKSDIGAWAVADSGHRWEIVTAILLAERNN